MNREIEFDAKYIPSYKTIEGARKAIEKAKLGYIMHIIMNGPDGRFIPMFFPAEKEINHLCAVRKFPFYRG